MWESRENRRENAAGHWESDRVLLGVCPSNDLGPVFGGPQTIDSIEIVDPEPNTRSRFESPSRQTHYWDRLLGIGGSPCPRVPRLDS